MEDDWKYIGDMTQEDVNSCNTIHCDTRDFHCALRENLLDLRDARHPEITRCKHDEKYFIDEKEVIAFLKSMEDISGGKGEWRMLDFQGYGNWCLKYIRFYRIKSGGKFIVCNIDDTPIYWKTLTEDKLVDRDLIAFDNGED